MHMNRFINNNTFVRISLEIISCVNSYHFDLEYHSTQHLQSYNNL